MSVCSYACDKCRIRLVDIEVDPADPTKKPECPKCGHCMGIQNEAPHINLKTSDLPGSGWETFQPAFNRHTTSKRDAMKALAELNDKESVLAAESGRPFNKFEWQPEMTKQDKE